ncbi:hypothetical protein A1OE_92 [Candidatus Endolissoclinum faulkneri L2]|uniref:Uncharacterized protein n=1 Tax=Candidatus Endolissoclinum faulkneri L2 TaxID=1193729 RepID=K7Z2V3_9PROT|nr:hypothetical protein A1OE_92 [Candidatus Endolissoclinum faulkneri L2]
MPIQLKTGLVKLSFYLFNSSNKAKLIKNNDHIKQGSNLTIQHNGQN